MEDSGKVRVFGCRAWVQVTDVQRRKLDPKAWKGILVDFDEHNTSCYRVFDPEGGVTRRSVHVTFNERLLPFRKRMSIAEE